MIFVQIAAYRDPELLPTIQDCLAKADFPDNLRFGICWQTGAEDRSLFPIRSLGLDRDFARPRRKMLFSLIKAHAESGAVTQEPSNP